MKINYRLPNMSQIYVHKGVWLIPSFFVCSLETTTVTSAARIWGNSTWENNSLYKAKISALARIQETPT